jgi:hypothetical protein
MVTVPADTPLTTPVDEPTVAIVVFPLLHVPGPTELVSVVVAPTHTFMLPVIVAGIGYTVTGIIAGHA